MDQKNYENLIKQFQINDKDTGSVPVQIIAMTQKINMLTEHLKIMKKDVPAKRTLLKTVAIKKRYLKYLQNHNYPRYAEFVQALNKSK